MWKRSFKDIGAGLLLRRPVSGVKMRSVESKDLWSPSATRNTECNVRRIVIHTQKTLSANGFLSTGKLTDTALSSSWTRTSWLHGRRQIGKKNKYKKSDNVSFEVEAASLQAARSEHDARFAVADKKSQSVNLRLSSVVDLRALGSRLKSLRQQPRSPSLRLIHTSSLYAVFSRPRSTTQLATNERRQKISDAKSKKSFRSALPKNGQSG